MLCNAGAELQNWFRKRFQRGVEGQSWSREGKDPQTWGCVRPQGKMLLILQSLKQEGAKVKRSAKEDCVYRGVRGENPCQSQVF